MKTLSYNSFPHKGRNFYYAYSKYGLVFVGSPNESLTEIHDFITVDKLICQPNHTYEEALSSYLMGKVTNFSLNTDLSWSSPFQTRIYEELKNIPFGKTISYSQLANILNIPTSTRAVATAVAKNPILMVIPCHRVIRKNGELGKYRGGTAFKKELLMLENSLQK